MAIASGPAGLVLAKPVFDVSGSKTALAQTIINNKVKIISCGALQSSKTTWVIRSTEH